MPNRLIDLAGRRFGRLTVIRRDGEKTGIERNTITNRLRRGISGSLLFCKSNLQHGTSLKVAQ